MPKLKVRRERESDKSVLVVRMLSGERGGREGGRWVFPEGGGEGGEEKERGKCESEAELCAVESGVERGNEEGEGWGRRALGGVVRCGGRRKKDLCIVLDHWSIRFVCVFKAKALFAQDESKDPDEPGRNGLTSRQERFSGSTENKEGGRGPANNLPL